MPPSTESPRGLRLLSLDGGPNGIPLLKTLKSISAHLLEEENRLSNIRGEPEQSTPRKLCEYFDMVAGSGSGGIIALMIGSLGMGVDEATDRYRLMLERVHANSDNEGSAPVQHARSNMLKSELEEVVTFMTGDARSLLCKAESEDGTCKTFVCTRNEHNLNTNTPVLLRSYESVNSVHKDCKIWEAGYATSATPGVFDSIQIGNFGPFVGGAWGCSNPTQVLLEEAAKEFPGRKIASVISVGTGHPKTIALSKSTLTDVAMQIAKDCEGVHERMLRSFANQKNIYHRFNVEQGLQMTDDDLLTDSAEVEAHTDTYLSSGAVQLAMPEVMKTLVQAVGKVDPNLLLSAPPPLPKGNRLLIRPPPPSRAFTGRKDMLNAIEASLRPTNDPDQPAVQKRFVLYGLGGSGKTQVALEFIHLYASRFTRRYLINASSEQTINTALENIGLELGIPEPTASDTLDCLCRFEEEWLLLYDNADEPSLNLHPFFPPCSHGNILVTSRNQEATNYAQPSMLVQQVHGMTPEDSISLLTFLTSQKSLNAENKALLPSVATTLGHLALALVQCGSYVAASPGMTFKKYMDMFKRRRKELLSRKSKPSVDLYEHTVYTTWTISFEALSNPAQSLLNICSFFHFDGITTEIFSQAALNTICEKHLHEACFAPGIEFLNQFSTIMIDTDGSSVVDVEAVWDDFGLNETIIECTSYSLMQQSLGESLSIHPLVQSWCQDHVKKEHYSTTLHMAQTVLALSASDAEHEQGSIHRGFLMPHINAALGVLPSLKMHPTVAQRFARALYLAGQCKVASQLWLEIVVQQETQFGHEHQETLISMNNLALSYADEGRHKEAEVIQLKVLEIWKRTVGLTHPDTLTGMNNLALTYRQQGQHKEAEVIQREVLEIQKSIQGLKDPDTLTSMSNLALTYSHQGWHEEAKALQVEVLGIRKHILGLTHPDTLISMNNLALTYSHQGQYMNAEGLQSEALELQKHTLGSAHPTTLLSMSNLAHVYMQRGQHKEAETLQVEVLGIQKHFLGSKHPDKLKSMHNLAVTYSQQGRYKEAETIQGEAVKMQKCILGSTHPETLIGMNNLALTYFEQGRHREAEAIRVEVLALQKHVLGLTHPDTLKSMNNLGSTYLQQGQYEEAEAIQMEAVELQKSILGSTHPETLAGMNNLGQTYSEQGRHKEAEAIQLEVLAIQKHVLGVTHPTTLMSQNNLAATYIHLGQHKEAEVIQLELLETQKCVQGPRHPQTLLAMNNLGQTYSEQGRHKEAEVIQVEVLAIQKSALGLTHPDTLKSQNNLAATYLYLGWHKEAEILQSEVLETQRRVHGSIHPETLRAMNNLGQMFSQQGRHQEAEAIQVEVLAIQKRVLGSTHPETLTGMSNLAFTYWQQGCLEKAEVLELEVLEARRHNVGKTHPDMLKAMNNLALTYLHLDRLDKAAALTVEVVEASQEHLGAEHPDALSYKKNLEAIQGKIALRDLPAAERVPSPDVSSCVEQSQESEAEHLPESEAELGASEVEREA